MIDHIDIKTTPAVHKKTVDFYVRALEPLGYKIVFEFNGGKVIGMGESPESPDFFIICETSEDPKRNLGNFHFAFKAKDQKTVDAAYAKAIEAGGKDNGAPGLRPQYHPSYYGAFVFDEMGNNCEFVHHEGKTG